MSAQPWCLWTAVALVVAGQLYYVPERLAFWLEVRGFEQAGSVEQRARIAYRPADYDLVRWIGRVTPPGARILILTGEPPQEGGAGDVLFHRALYDLYPRTVFWAAPGRASWYPAFCIPVTLSELEIRAVARQVGATVILAVGFPRAPVRVPLLSFDRDTHLLFLEGP